MLVKAHTFITPERSLTKQSEDDFSWPLLIEGNQYPHSYWRRRMFGSYQKVTLPPKKYIRAWAHIITAKEGEGIIHCHLVRMNKIKLVQCGLQTPHLILCQKHQEVLPFWIGSPFYVQLKYRSLRGLLFYSILLFYHSTANLLVYGVWQFSLSLSLMYPMTLISFILQKRHPSLGGWAYWHHWPPTLCLHITPHLIRSF